MPSRHPSPAPESAADLRASADGADTAEAAPDALKPMLFVHIPKTAGTSVRVGAVEYLGNARTAFDYGPKEKNTSRMVQRFLHQERKPQAFRNAFDRRGLKFFTGHIRLSDHVGFFDLDNVAVFLRDPVQRIMSEYRHFVRHYGYTDDIETFIANPVFQNKQARAIAGVRLGELGFVGIAEEFEESLRRLNRHFGWEIPFKQTNLGRSGLAEPHDIKPRLRRRILQANPLDQALYEEACRLFQEGPAEAEAPRTAAIGSCKLHEDSLLKGWACRIGAEVATWVRVEVNDQEVAMLRADRFRSDIRQRGLKRSGCAGFEMSMPNIGKGDVIRCFETDGGTELNNSPIRVEG